MKRKKIPVMRYAVLLLVLTVIAAMTSWVSAHFVRSSVNITDSFAPAVSIIPTIEEKFENNVKENVYFKVGDTQYPVYVRAKLIVTWKNDEGVIYFTAPSPDTDYQLDLELSGAGSTTGWIAGNDGYYYYQNIVQSGGQTSELIKKCVPLNPAPVPDYSLSVDVLVQTVQAVGYTDEDDQNNVFPAVKDAWDVTPPSAATTTVTTPTTTTTTTTE